MAGSIGESVNIPLVIIMLNSQRVESVYLEGKGAGNRGVGALYFQAVLGACGEVALDEEVAARAAVVVGGEQGFALVEFTDGVESPGCGEHISSGFRGRKLVPAVLPGGEGRIIPAQVRTCKSTCPYLCRVGKPHPALKITILPRVYLSSMLVCNLQTTHLASFWIRLFYCFCILL